MSSGVSEVRIVSMDKAQNLSDENRFKLATYAAAVEEDTEEDTLWEHLPIKGVDRTNHLSEGESR